MTIRLETRSIHTFVVGTARWLGLTTTATLANRTHEPVLVEAQVRNHLGQQVGAPVRLGRLGQGETQRQPLPHLLAKRQFDGGEAVVTFSLVPEALDETRSAGLDVGDVFRRIGAQDHHVGHRKGGYAFGVHYQTPPLNDARFHRDFSFLMQSPKVLLGARRNTLVQLLHPSTDPGHRRQGRLACRLRHPDGHLVYSWEETVAPHGMTWVDLRARLQEAGIRPEGATDAGGFALLEAFSAETSFLPLIYNHDETRGTFAVEHSLPPVYYASAIRAGRKLELVRAALSN